MFFSEKLVKSFVICHYKPEKFQSQLTNMIVYDIDIFNTDRAVPYAICMNRLSENSINCSRDITEKEYQNCLYDCVVFKGGDCVNELLDHVLQLKRESKRVKKNIV